MRILITGKNGQVGTELSRLYQSHGDVVLAGRPECDLASEQSVRDVVGRVKPAVIINAGAYTAVDQAENERALCFAINSDAPRVLAQEAARLDALLIHYSTDYVFNGEKSGPYLESDPTSPWAFTESRKRRAKRRSPRQGAVIWCSAPAGFIARMEKISFAPCFGWAPSAPNCGWSTIRSAPPPQRQPLQRPRCAYWSSRRSDGHLSHDGRGLHFVVWFRPRHF